MEKSINFFPSLKPLTYIPKVIEKRFLAFIQLLLPSFAENKKTDHTFVPYIHVTVCYVIVAFCAFYTLSTFQFGKA